VKVHELIKRLQELDPEVTVFLEEKYSVDDGDGYMDEMTNNIPIQKVTSVTPSMVILT